MGVEKQADDKLVTVSRFWDYENEEIIISLIRFETDGTFDASFGNNGKVIIGVENDNQPGPYGIALQSNQNILVRGYVNGVFIVRQYSPSGKKRHFTKLGGFKLYHLRYPVY